MRCVKCKGKVKVVNSRCSEDDVNKKYIPEKFNFIRECFTYRDHKCLSCGGTSQTIQIRAEAIKDIEKDAKNKIINGLQDMIKAT